MGLGGLAEAVEVKLAAPAKVEDIIRSVNAVLPEGIELRGGHDVQDGAPKFSRTTAWVDYCHL